MASFNAEATISRAINSVLNQKNVRIELLIKDGSGTDRTSQIIESHLKGITWYCSSPDQGVYDALNHCLDKATGDWIYIIGADDYLADDLVLRTLVDLAEGAALVAGRIHNINRRHSAIPEFHSPRWGVQLLWRNTIHQQGVIYHSSLFGNFRFESRYKVLADYDFHLKLFRENNNAITTSMIVAHCEASGISKYFTTELYHEELIIKRKRLPLLLYLINCVVIPVKYFFKRFTS